MLAAYQRKVDLRIELLECYSMQAFHEDYRQFYIKLTPNTMRDISLF